MIAEYKTKTNIGVGAGIILHISGRILVGSGDLGTIIGVLLLLTGTIFFVWGCWMYTKGKGYHGAWGLLGTLSLLGLIILVCFKDKHK